MGGADTADVAGDQPGHDVRQPPELLMFNHRSRSRLDPIRRRRSRRSPSGEPAVASRRPTISSAELERLYNYGTLLRVR
jgi:hypothetical protein